MKKILYFALLFFATVPGWAFETGQQGLKEQICYGNAMLGYDSVINSRLGVPAEHALELARTRHNVYKTVYSGQLLSTILAAYLWQGSPHTYATHVFFKCAQEQTVRDPDLDIVVVHK